ncbi:unnamed protein product [Effrenium voratum]|nr:unnamed protein product [Effrenium voratum]
MAEAAPLDERLQEEMESVMSSVDDARKTNRKKFPVETLKTFDSLFVGHSNHHVQNPFQLWEDVTLAIRKRFKGKCKRPLYNDVGLFHEKDVAMDLLDGSKTAPEGHFSLIAVLHVVLDATGFQRLQKLLKPGGVLIWNTWWREHPGEVPDMKRLGFEKLKDEELPLSYVTSPWQESGFTYRICYARRAGKGGGGFR